MRYAGPILIVLAACPALAQQVAAPPASHPVEHRPPAQTQPAVLITGMGHIHHPVLTLNRDAQRAFNQGLALTYAFNHDEAVRSFEQAARLDPNMAMAYWGKALALGPNINMPMDADRGKAAYDAVRRALQLASNRAPQEQAYIQALARRYSADPDADRKQLDLDYSHAMKDLSRRYPDDLDAATLYAESLMDLHPWRLWRPDGTAEPDTREALAVLESVLRRNPDHTGANHYYIHCVEAGPAPQQAYASASRLATLAPAAGHLVHMPSHIYIRLGDYQAAADSNDRAAAADRAYIDKYNPTGIYPLMYYGHNLHFIAVCRGLLGQAADATIAAQALADHLAPHVQHMEMLQMFLATPLLIQVQFGRWDDILKAPAPPADQAVMTVYWRFARAMACAATGDLGKARAERSAFARARQAIPADTMISPSNKAADVFRVAEQILDARLAFAEGDRQAALQSLQRAIEAEDALGYMEPPDWYLFPREYLGGVLLAAEPDRAEQAFRDNLARHPRSGRSLFGLLLALRAQHKIYESQLVEPQFMQAWEGADTMLRAEDLWDIRPPLVPARDTVGSQR